MPLSPPRRWNSRIHRFQSNKHTFVEVGAFPERLGGISQQFSLLYTRFSARHVRISHTDIVVCRAGKVLIFNLSSLAERSNGFIVSMHLNVDASHGLFETPADPKHFRHFESRVERLPGHGRTHLV